MGRRSLRKIDPRLDLTPYLLSDEQLPDPWDAVALFGRAAPLEIEVGSGKGLFLATAAAATPEHDFLGVEISRKYARYTAARLAKAEAHNARILHGDAMRLCHEKLPFRTIRAVHVYFPDPWWKKRHHKRRVMNQRFITDVQRILESGGQFHFWTDVEEYFQSSLALLQAATELEGPYDVAEAAPQHELDFRTHFERRMRLHHETVHRTRFVKRGSGEKAEGRGQRVEGRG